MERILIFHQKNGLREIAQKFRWEVVDKQNPARYNMPCGSVEALGLAGRGQCGSSSVVEHHLAKVGVAGSSPVFRSIIIKPNNFFYRTDFGAN